jgi:hypothetical protein
MGTGARMTVLLCCIAYGIVFGNKQ